MWGALRIIGTVRIIIAGLPQYMGICIRIDAPGKWGCLQGKMVPCKMDNFRATGSQKCEMTQWCPGAGGLPQTGQVFPENRSILESGDTQGI